MFMDGEDLYDDDEATVTSTSNANAERWTNMSTSERNNERIQRKKERQKKKKGANNKDNTVVEDFDYDWDDDEDEETQIDKATPGTNVAADDAVFDDPEFMRTAVEEHARYLGMDPADPDHSELMWIAEEALTAPLPDDWEQGVTDDGTPYFFNVETKESVWDHPLDEHYQKVFKVELKKLKKKKIAKKEQEEEREKEKARLKKQKEEKERREAEAERKRIQQEEEAERKRLQKEAERKKAEQQQEKRVKRSNRNNTGISNSLSSSSWGRDDALGGDSLDLALGGSSVSRINTSKSTSPTKSKKVTTNEAFSISQSDVSPNTKWKNDMAELVVEDDIDDGNESIDFETSTELDETNVMVGSVRINSNNKNQSNANINKSYGKSTTTLSSTINNNSSNNNNNYKTNNNDSETILKLQNEINKLKQENSSIESGFQIELERHKRFSDEYKKEAEELRIKVNNIKSENKEAEKSSDESIKELKNNLNKLVEEKKNVEAVQFDLKKEKARADGFEVECKKLRDKLLEGEESVRSAERNKDEMNNLLKSATDKKKELIQENIDFKKNISDLQSQITVLEKKVKIRDNAKRNLQNDNKKMEQEFKTEKETLIYRTKEVEEELKSTTTKVDEQKNQISELKQTIQSKLNEIEALKEKYDDFEIKTKSKLSDIESEQVRRVKKDMLDEMLEIKNKHRVAIELADAKRLKLEKEIQDSKIMASKATETLESRLNALKNNLLEVEEERNASKRELQETVERLAVVESLRNADHEECVQHRRTVLQVKEENEELQRKLVNSKNEETLIKAHRELEDMKKHKTSVENENKDLTLKLEKSKVQFKAMIETAMRRAANEASQDTALEWQKRLDQEMLDNKQVIDELKFQLKDSNDQLRQRDKELVEFERKYARSSASLEVSQKEVNSAKSEMEDLKRQLRTATEKIVYQKHNGIGIGMTSGRGGNVAPPPAPETTSGPGLIFSVPQQPNLLLNNSANNSLEQSMQMEMIQQHLSLLKTQAAAAASMVAQVQNVSGKRNDYEDIRTAQDEREEDDYHNTISSALEMSGRTHQVLSDLNISYGRKGPLGSSKSVVMSSPVVPGLKSRSVYGSGVNTSTTLTLSGSKKPLGRDSWYKKGYWKTRYKS